MEHKATDFQTREELDKHIAGAYGATTEPKFILVIETDEKGVETEVEDEVIIVGTRDELEKMNLTDQTRVWGVRCVITDTPTESKPQIDVPDRGKIFTSGLNLEAKDIKEEK